MKIKKILIILGFILGINHTVMSFADGTNITLFNYTVYTFVVDNRDGIEGLTVTGFKPIRAGHEETFNVTTDMGSSTEYNGTIIFNALDTKGKTYGSCLINVSLLNSVYSTSLSQCENLACSVLDGDISTPTITCK